MKRGKTKEKGREPQIADEFKFNPARMRRLSGQKRHIASPGEVDLRNCKVRITMYLDADIVEHFKRRAAAPDAAPYQTQINTALRGVLESESSSVYDLLEDERFIKAVAAKVRDCWRGSD